MRPKLSIFSSDYNNGQPCMVTGIFKSEDFAKFLEEHPRFHHMINHEVRMNKVAFFKKNLHLKKSRHEIESMHEPHLLKQLKIRHWWMLFYRHVTHVQNDDAAMMSQLANHRQNPA